MNHVKALRCTICGESYSPQAVDYICPNHGDSGNLDVEYDYDAIRATLDLKFEDRRDMWRYKPLLPIDADAIIPPLNVGGTPLYRISALANELGIGDFWIKDEGRNPTASLKDRAGSLLVAKAVYDGRQVITVASSGNAGAAIAGMSASVKLPALIFLPRKTPEAKIVQLLVYGAHVFLVDGEYSDAFQLAKDASRKFGWYCLNAGFNPYAAEGNKTVSYEICEELAGIPGGFAVPDAVLVSVGDGNIISGVYKGLFELSALGLVDHLPRLIGVQANGSAAIANAWLSGIDPENMEPVRAQTVAEGLVAADLPADRVKAMNAVNNSGGTFITVSDEEILAAIPAIARASGVFCEPAAAAAFAGLIKAISEGKVDETERVVVLITGNGLKDIESARKVSGKPHVINPDLKSVEAVVRNILGFKLGTTQSVS